MRKIVILLLAALALSACLTIDESNFKALEPIGFNEVPATIDVSLGQTLVYDKLVVTSNLPLEYQWAYGKKKLSGKTEYDMESMEVISTDPQINYTFKKLGSYILRLRVDNGESVEYKYFTLNVNSGLDEGLLILEGDEDGANCGLTFIKRRNEDEIAEGAREIWEDVFTTMNPDCRLQNAKSLFLSAFVAGGISYNHLAIATGDADGTIYDLDPKTMTVVSTLAMRDEYGTWCEDFAGAQTSSGGAYTFLRGGNGHVYRYDLFSPFITERTDCWTTAGEVRDSRMLIYSAGTNGTLYTKSAFYTDSFICQPGTTATTAILYAPSGWKIVNFCPDRDANKVYVLLQSQSNPSAFAIKSTTGSLQAFKDVTEFTADAVTMDSSSRFCGSLNSNDVYYVWNNRVYRWGLATKPSDSAVITLPEGETVCDIATNFMGARGDGTEETLLYIATWSRGNQGSVYVYDIATDSLQKTYKSVCRRPIKLLYKYRIS